MLAGDSPASHQADPDWFVRGSAASELCQVGPSLGLRLGTPTRIASPKRLGLADRRRPAEHVSRPRRLIAVMYHAAVQVSGVQWVDALETARHHAERLPSNPAQRPWHLDDAEPRMDLPLIALHE